MSLNETIEHLLRSNPAYIGENDEILRTKVMEAVSSLDPFLVKAFRENNLTREVFFKKIDDVWIMNQEKLNWVVNSREFLPDSYTGYKSEIGLTSGGKFLKAITDVVLDFPYKDAILVGGQDKDDQKREEIMYHEVLGYDQITNLNAPKVLGNAKRYSEESIEEGIQYNENDNLIIKGNNYTALNSLLERFEGKIQCIYIDPPFNTDGDTFLYNDRFNHSTWLTFMKNRLLLAKKLLKEDGSIFVHVDFNESHYLKVLMDSIFGIENYRNDIAWCYTGPSGSKNFLPRKHDTILFYSKSGNLKFNQPYIKHKSGVHNTGQVFGKTESEENFKEDAEEKGKKLEDWWIDIYSTDRYRSELIGFSGQKPEKLLRRIIEMGSDEGDIVLDFHLGSGTTASVAHKLNRRYIGVEQMEYINQFSVSRLIDVIQGSQLGISKEVDWKGGGSFVYCEFLEDGQRLVDLILSATNDTIYEVKKAIYHSDQIVPYILTADLEKADKDFNELTLNDQKEILIRLIDKNKLYVNYSSIDDDEYEVSEKDKSFSKSFYEGSGMHE